MFQTVTYSFNVYGNVYSIDYVPEVQPPACDDMGGPLEACYVCDTNNCQPSCEFVFELVHVSYLIRGGTRVMWRLTPEFSDPRPWVFQLQSGSTGSNESHDWRNVGLPVEDSVFAVDPDQSDFSNEISTHYRIVLTTPVATYTSQPTGKQGVLNARDWRLAREIIRKERVRNRYATQDGYLLKRLVTGIDCATCLDLQTKEVTDPDCPECLGTGKQCGYFYPINCVWADISPAQSSLRLDEQGMRGTVNDLTAQARMLMLPIISEMDVWVSAKTDERYLIRGIKNIAEMRGVPLIASVELRKLPFTDIVYSVVIEEQELAWS